MPLAIFYDCTAQFVLDLVGNPEETFFHDTAHLNVCPVFYHVVHVTFLILFNVEICG